MKKYLSKREQSRMNDELLFHYTTLNRLMDILKNNRLSLRDPSRWSDQNDAFSVRKSSDSAVGVICFSCNKREVNLFWESYAREGIGVCVLFNKSALEKEINGKEGYLFKRIDYLHKKGDNLFNERNEPYCVKSEEDFAFIKYNSYACENEYRLVFFSKTNQMQIDGVVEYLEFKEKLDHYIHKIYITPFLDKSQRLDVKMLLEAYLEKMDLSNIKVRPSKIANDVKWRNGVRKLKRTLKRKNESL